MDFLWIMEHNGRDMNQRHEEILKFVSSGREASVQELSEKLRVSLVTIRSDLRLLEEEGLLLRTHGGATLRSEDDIARRMGIRFAEKQRIAREAASLVCEGETIFLEAGSCIALTARELCSFRHLNVLTNNAFVARQFREAPGIRVILLGGEFQKDSETMVGPMIGAYMRYYNFSKAFLGMDGFTLEDGAMGRDIDRVEAMSTIAGAADELVLLSDSSKFGRKGLRSFTPLSRIDRIVTDEGIPGPFRETVTAAGIRLHMV
jgi:DeoR/GlpR family transcriptional regulator of sugar metabolism